MKIFNRQYFSGQATLLQHYITNLCTRVSARTKFRESRIQENGIEAHKKTELKIQEMGKTLIFRRLKIEF